MSNSVIYFTGSGAAEESRRVPQRWLLSVCPNPARGAFSVRYDVSLTLAFSQREREGGKWGLYRAESDAGAPGDCLHFPVRLGIYDAGRRLVRSLSDDAVAPGRYEARIPSGRHLLSRHAGIPVGKEGSRH
jgi:hypothetical protein